MLNLSSIFKFYLFRTGMSFYEGSKLSSSVYVPVPLLFFRRWGGAPLSSAARFPAPPSNSKNHCTPSLSMVRGYNYGRSLLCVHRSFHCVGCQCNDYCIHGYDDSQLNNGCSCCVSCHHSFRLTHYDIHLVCSGGTCSDLIARTQS